MNYTLIDSPLTPYSTHDEIRAWVRECGLMAEKNPDDSGWLDALNEAQELASMIQPKYICPACRQKTGVDILYGMPTPEAACMAERGEIVLGGCCIELEGPERQCTACGHQWRIKRRLSKEEKQLLEQYGFPDPSI